MHESKGQHIGKAPSLHLFHTTADAMLLDHISLVLSRHEGEEKWPGDEAKYCIYCVSAPSLHRESTDSLMNVMSTDRLLVSTFSIKA